jgi:hypothetical protein
MLGVVLLIWSLMPVCNMLLIAHSDLRVVSISLGYHRDDPLSHYSRPSMTQPSMFVPE